MSIITLDVECQQNPEAEPDETETETTETTAEATDQAVEGEDIFQEQTLTETEKNMIIADQESQT